VTSGGADPLWTVACSTRRHPRRTEAGVLMHARKVPTTAWPHGDACRATTRCLPRCGWSQPASFRECTAVTPSPCRVRNGDLALRECARHPHHSIRVRARHGPGHLGLGTLITAFMGFSLVGWQLREQRRAMRAEFGTCTCIATGTSMTTFCSRRRAQTNTGGTGTGT
jgi:hypothetical protein